MKRVFWFTAGVATGVAGTKWAEQKLKHAAAAAKPRAVAARLTDKVRDALSEGRLGMRQKEAELRGRDERHDRDHRGGRGDLDPDGAAPAEGSASASPGGSRLHPELVPGEAHWAAGVRVPRA